MTLDVTITFRGMPSSEALEARIRNRTDELARISRRPGTCRVVLEATDRYRKSERIYHVHIDLMVGRACITVSQDTGPDYAREDAHVAIRDGFDAARRMLQEHVDRLEGRVKHHEAPPALG